MGSRALRLTSRFPADARELRPAVLGRREGVARTGWPVLRWAGGLRACTTDRRGGAVIVEYIRYRIQAGGGPAFEAAYARAAEVLARSPYCRDYELTRRTDEQTGPTAVEPDDAEHYVLRIRWTSSADHLTGFRQGPDFRPFFAAIRPYLGDIEEMRHYAPTTVVGTGAAGG